MPRHKLGSIERDIWTAFKNRKKIHRSAVYDHGVSDCGYNDRQVNNALQRLAMKGLIRYASLYWRR